MSRRPDDEMPDPPGGRAARRLRDFMERRAPADDDVDVPPDADEGSETEDDSSEENVDP